MNIITNNHPRPMLALWELPAKVQKDFNYVMPDDGSCRFVKYKGEWVDCFDMMRAPDTLPGWQGYASDTFFSGTLVRFVNDNDVIVGRYYA